MTDKKASQIYVNNHNSDQAEDFSILSYQILNYANLDLPRVDFLRKISKMLIDFSECNSIELWLIVGGKQNSCEIISRTKKSFHFKIISYIQRKNNYITSGSKAYSDLERLCNDVMTGHTDPSLPFFTKNCAFWIGDVEKKIPLYDLKINKNYKSFAIIPLVVGDERIGLLQLNSRKKYLFNKFKIEIYEKFAKTLGLALINQRSQAALRERVKELTCLYGISRIVEQPEVSLENILQNTVELLPPAWQYPKITHGRISLDNQVYSTPGFKESPYKQTADIVVNRKKRGSIEVVYLKEKSQLDEGPFLKEERNLIDNISRELALIIERRESKEEKIRLREQLRHSDRLATIGQLTAGVAHELNEPLSNILGFAQLAKKCTGLPKQADKDIENIVTSSLYAREIIKKLMLFTRQTPSQKTTISLNQVVEDGLYFLESRCRKEGIEVFKTLLLDLPLIQADPSQLNQVLVNLVVNAIQAMSGGGILTLKTIASETYVSLIVEDTGIGINDELLKQIFIPFFTTKDVGQGTGLGLSVVHGIVTSHRGSIRVESKVGCGSKFEIKFPVSKINLIGEE